LLLLCTSITLSQKRLEIQAHRCNGETNGRCQHRRHHGIIRFQLDSDVCSADLHHNPRKHVGLRAHQRLHRLPLDGLSGRPRLRVARVVVLAGHLLAWLGSRQSVEPVTGHTTPTSWIHVLPCLLTLMPPRLWSAPAALSVLR
jgi:hypothetical protein